MIKAVIFDFFGVIVTERLKQFLDVHFKNDLPKRKQAIDAVTQYDSGITNMSRQDLLEELASLTHLNAQEVQEYLDQNKPNDLLLDYIRTDLKPKYEIGILSNAGDDFVAQFLDPTDQKLFDQIVLSYRHGMAKPQQEIYELAAERLGVNITECVFVDDSESHCEGARRAGMKTIWYEDLAQVKRDLQGILPSSSNH